MVAINPCAFRDVLAAAVFILEPPGRLDTIVPSLAALIANVAGPGSTWAFIVLLDRDPGDACRIIVVRYADVACIQPRRVLIDDLFADSAGVNFAPFT